MNDPYIQAMFGCHAIHSPMNFIVQAYEEDGVFLAVAQARVNKSLFKRLTFNSRRTHQMIIGDIVLRPQLVIESDHLRGCGISGILTSGLDPQEWASRGKVIFDYKK